MCFWFFKKIMWKKKCEFKFQKFQLYYYESMFLKRNMIFFNPIPTWFHKAGKKFLCILSFRHFFFFPISDSTKNQIKHTNQCIFIVVCWRTRFSTSSNSNFWMYWRNGTRSWNWNLFFKLIWWFRRIEWKWCLNRWLHWNLKKIENVSDVPRLLLFFSKFTTVRTKWDRIF